MAPRSSSSRTCIAVAAASSPATTRWRTSQPRARWPSGVDAPRVRRQPGQAGVRRRCRDRRRVQRLDAQPVLGRRDEPLEPAAASRRRRAPPRVRTRSTSSAPLLLGDGREVGAQRQLVHHRDAAGFQGIAHRQAGVSDAAAAALAGASIRAREPCDVTASQAGGRRRGRRRAAAWASQRDVQRPQATATVAVGEAGRLHDDHAVELESLDDADRHDGDVVVEPGPRRPTVLDAGGVEGGRDLRRPARRPR